MASIYFEKTGSLQFGRAFSLIKTHDIGDIDFFVYQKNPAKKQVFLVLEDEQGLRDIVELQKIGVASENKPYKVYRISLRQKLRLTTSKVKLSMFILEAGSDEYQASKNSLSLSITTDRFNLHREIFLSQELGAKTKLYYEKIVTLLEQLEIDEKGDN